MALYTNNFNNKGFTSPNTSKPIAGTCAVSAYNNRLKQAIATEDNLIPGEPALVKTSATQGNAGVLGNPNLLNASNGKSEISGFFVQSPSDYVADGSEAGTIQKNQTPYIALLGSGVELYLAIKSADAINKNVASLNLKWDDTNKELVAEADATLAIQGLKIVSNVVDGLRIKKDGDKYIYEVCALVKVLLS